MEFISKSNNIDRISNNIWIGNFIASLNTDLLKSLGITKVLTVVDNMDLPNYSEEKYIRHKKVNVADNCRENIIQYFGECINFIKGGDNILVHCMVGASRSSTVVIAYLMWAYRWTYQQAYKYVLSKRQIARPNEGFDQQLKLFERLLLMNNYNLDNINFKGIKWEPPQNLINDYQIYEQLLFN